MLPLTAGAQHHDNLRRCSFYGCSGLGLTSVITVGTVIAIVRWRWAKVTYPTMSITATIPVIAVTALRNERSRERNCFKLSCEIFVARGEVIGRGATKISPFRGSDSCPWASDCEVNRIWTWTCVEGTGTGTSRRVPFVGGSETGIGREGVI